METSHPFYSSIFLRPVQTKDCNIYNYNNNDKYINLKIILNVKEKQSPHSSVQN